MTPEERSLLERTHKLAEENNEMLMKIRRSNKIGLIFRVLYWVVIIGISFGAFYLVKPLTDTIFGVYTGQNQDGTTQERDLNTTDGVLDSLKDLLK